MMPKTTKYLVESGIITALGTLLIFLSGVIPVMSVGTIAVAGVFPAVLVLRYGVPAAIPAYAATAVLSMLISPDKAAALMYIVVFGHYPLLKSIFERRKNRLLEWACKIITANAALAVMLMLVFSFTLTGTLSNFLNSEFFSLVFLPVIIPVFTLIFVVYDIGLTKLIAFFGRRITKL